MPLPIIGIILRLTHTGKAGDSVYITDLGDGTDVGSYRKVGPVYVPRVDPTTKTFPGHVDLPFANDVHLSYTHPKGGIRSFIDNGYLLAEFFFGTLAQQAATGQVTVTTTPYTVRPGDRELHVCTPGPVTIQLPAIADHQTERVFIIDARGTAAVNPITVLPAPGETVLGGASAVINSNYGLLDLFANCPGTNWFTSTGVLYIEDLPTHELNPAKYLRPDGLGGVQWLLGGGGGGDTLRDYVFTQDIAVPKAGTLYLKAGTVTTASTPLVISKAMAMRGASISTEVADAARTYTLQVTKNGVPVESLSLPSGSRKITANTFSTALAPLDEVAVYLTRTGGPAAKSDFKNVLTTLELLEL